MPVHTTPIRLKCLKTSNQADSSFEGETMSPTCPETRTWGSMEIEQSVSIEVAVFYETKNASIR